MHKPVSTRALADEEVAFRRSEHRFLAHVTAELPCVPRRHRRFCPSPFHSVVVNRTAVDSRKPFKHNVVVGAVSVVVTAAAVDSVEPTEERVVHHLGSTLVFRRLRWSW